MDVTEEVLTNEKYRKQINQLSFEALEKLANDPVKAMEMVIKGVSEIEPEKSKDVEYLQSQADEMQKLAKALLTKRYKNS